MKWLDGTTGRRADRASRRRRERPTVEICEARALLAAFFVDNNNDDGGGSLREAIRQSNLDSTDPLNTIEFR